MRSGARIEESVRIVEANTNIPADSRFPWNMADFSEIGEANAF
jgi:hypothetical protein